MRLSQKKKLGQEAHGAICPSFAVVLFYQALEICLLYHKLKIFLSKKIQSSITCCCFDNKPNVEECFWIFALS